MKIVYNTVFGEDTFVKVKECIYCKITFPLDSFPKHMHNHDGYDSRCKSCIKKRDKEIKILRKISPPNPGYCECCGRKEIPLKNNTNKKIFKLSLDHDYDENGNARFRGWLCSDCNLAIGALGDNIEGVKNALNYLMLVRI